MKTINRIIMNHTRRNTVRTGNRAEKGDFGLYLGATTTMFKHITTDWMLYEVYVDCVDRGVVGCEPMPVDVWSPEYRENAANSVLKKQAEYLTKYQLVVQ